MFSNFLTLLLLLYFLFFTCVYIFLSIVSLGTFGCIATNVEKEHVCIYSRSFMCILLSSMFSFLLCSRKTRGDCSYRQRRKCRSEERARPIWIIITPNVFLCIYLYVIIYILEKVLRYAETYQHLDYMKLVVKRENI